MDDSFELAIPRSFDEEAEDVRLAKARDPQVWSRWYDRHYATLYRYAFVRLGNREDAEDVASQVFLQALRKIDGYGYRGRPVLAWLYRIAHNLVADRLRTQKQSTPLRDDRQSAGMSVAGVEDRIDGIELRRALAELKPEQSEVIVLRFFLSMPTREVAALLGKSEAAVHSLQVRGIAALRLRLSR